MSALETWLRLQIAADEVEFAAETPELEAVLIRSGDLNDGYLVGIGYRMRAECAAKRAILDAGSPSWRFDDQDGGADLYGRGGCETALSESQACNVWDTVLREFARVYSDRDGYDPAWFEPAPRPQWKRGWRNITAEPVPVVYNTKTLMPGDTLSFAGPPAPHIAAEIDRFIRLGWLEPVPE